MCGAPSCDDSSEPRLQKELDISHTHEEAMVQKWVTRLPSSTLAMSACLGCSTAFVTPSSLSIRGLQQQQQQQQQRQHRVSAASRVESLGRSSTLRMAVQGQEESTVAPSGAEDAEAKAAKLRAFAAELRAQAEELESQRDSDKKAAAQQAFASFDTNDDGTVDVQELIAGLEGQLRKDFVKRMTKTMKRKPSQSEVDEKISEMPGGALLPVDVGKKLIEIYDTNGDGVLQASEFAPKEDLRVRLESLFADRAQAARLEAAAARELEIENRGIEKAREAAKARGIPLPEDFNDGPPTVGDKLLSVLPYTLPLMDSLAFGAHIFQTFPTQLSFLEPVVAILLIYRSLPFSGLILFFGLQWYASKPQVNKLVRYNLRQAVNLDIAMFFPSILSFLIAAVVGQDGAAKLAPLAIAGSDVIFVTVVLCALYSIGSSALGVLPEALPLIGGMNQEGTRGKDEGDKKIDRDGDDKQE